MPVVVKRHSSSRSSSSSGLRKKEKEDEDKNTDHTSLLSYYDSTDDEDDDDSSSDSSCGDNSSYVSSDSSSSESEYDESLRDDDDDSSSGSDAGSHYTTDSGYCTTDSESCNTFLETVTQELHMHQVENFHRRSSHAAGGGRHAATKRRASLSALDLLKSASNHHDSMSSSISCISHDTTTDDDDEDEPQRPNSRRTLAKQRSLRTITDRMNDSSASVYFQDPHYNSSTSIAAETPPLMRSRTAPTKFRAANLQHTASETPHQESPSDCLKQVLEGIQYDSHVTTTAYFLEVTSDRMDRYTGAVAKAVRAQDLTTLRQLYATNSECLEACNSQGESLVHLACRRRHLPLLEFLVREAQVSLRVKDDWGKSPLHEQCWNTTTTTQSYFSAVKLILEKEPQLLFCKDKRGYQPLDYIPREHWNKWCHFLNTHKVWLRCQVQMIGYAQSRQKLQHTLQLAQQVLSCRRPGGGGGVTQPQTATVTATP